MFAGVPQLRGFALPRGCVLFLALPAQVGLGLMLAAGLGAALITGPAQAQVIGGFGAQTVGGTGGTLYRVTSLADTGPGTLRDAISEGNRLVVFDVAGDIVLQNKLRITSAFLTIDGCSAPPPGITIRDGYGLILQGAHDVIIRCLRIRNVTGFGDASSDGISVRVGSYNILIHHVSVHGSIDGNLDIAAFPAVPGNTVHDVTVAWSILAEPAGTEKNMLIKYNPSRVTLHHNLFVGARQRNPQVRIDDAGTPATETTVDMRNNVVYDWSGCCGTQIWYGPWANVVANYYGCPGCTETELPQGLRVQNGARAYVADNVSGDGFQLNDVGTEATPFPAPPMEAEDACTAAKLVLAQAGVRPLDEVDENYLSGVTLAGCEPGAPGPPPPPPPPGPADLAVTQLAVRLPRGSRTAEVLDAVANLATGAAGPSTLEFYLSETAGLGPGALLLGSRRVTALGPGGTDSGATMVTIPAQILPGRYFVIAVADAGAELPESDESNNSRAKRVRVR